jgi:hypothetical protein
VFRRRHRGEADRPGYDSGTAQDDPELYDDLNELDEGDGYGLDQDLARPATRSRGRHAAPGSAYQAAGESGPWDGAGDFPARERMDFGSLLLPMLEGLDIQVNMAEDTGVWIAIVHGDSALQLQAFAAPKTSGLWDEVRHEIADEVTKSGGDCQQAQGPFGAELHARVSPGEDRQRQRQLEPVRFLGVDGPRWFLRGVISGPAARRPELARPFEELFGDVVVVRGDHPLPPRELLEIRLPEDARRALEEQIGQDAEGPAYPSPFERGPEITETR